MLGINATYRPHLPHKKRLPTSTPMLVMSCHNIQRNRIARDTLQEDDVIRISMITQTQNSHCPN